MGHQRAVLNQVNVVCRDLAVSIAFYRLLGVDIREEAIWRTASGTHHASADGAEVEAPLGFAVDSVPFARMWNVGWKEAASLAGRVVVGFRLTSREAVDAAYERLTAAGHAGLQPPHDAFWGARHAIVEDPDGVAVGLMSPASENKREHVPDI
jgi:catechol 2,3-dioxygenase-like lactoylglutathione lyase family enzyme